MKRKYLGVFIVGLTTLLFACNAQKTESAAVIDKEQIKKEIQAKEDEFAATYNAGIVKEIGYYADDAISFFQNRPALVGKDAIVEFLKADVHESGAIRKISFKTNDVFVSNDGNLVVEVGYFTVVDSTNTGINKGNYMSVFEKRNGKYVCVRDMSASDVVLPSE